MRIIQAAEEETDMVIRHLDFKDASDDSQAINFTRLVTSKYWEKNNRGALVTLETFSMLRR